MVGYSPSQKIADINKAFSDSYKSPLSVIVIDNLERLIGQSLFSPFYLLCRLTLYRMGEHWSQLLEPRLASTTGFNASHSTKGRV